MVSVAPTWRSGKLCGRQRTAIAVSRRIIITSREDGRQRPQICIYSAGSTVHTIHWGRKTAVSPFLSWRNSRAYSWLDSFRFGRGCNRSPAHAGPAAAGNHPDDHFGNRRIVRRWRHWQHVQWCANHLDDAFGLARVDSRRVFGVAHRRPGFEKPDHRVVSIQIV